MRRRLLGPRAAKTVSVLADLGTIAAIMGNEELAVERFEKALQSYPEGTRFDTLSRSHSNLAIALSALGRYDEAIEHFEASIKLTEEGESPDHPNLVATLSMLSEAQTSRGELEEALKTGRRALEIADARLPPGHRTTVVALYSLANAEFESQMVSEAAAHLERGLQFADEGSSSAMQQAQVEFLLARCLRRMGEPAGRAESLARTARTRLINVGGHEDLVAEIEAWL
jgi:tetratricopeptide (TPR) repeat protein